jgi:hypothetical protein
MDDYLDDLDQTFDDADPDETPRMSMRDFKAAQALQHQEAAERAAERKKALDRIYVSNHDSSVDTPQDDWDEEERTYNHYLLQHGDAVSVSGAVTTLMKAVGGPFDGMPINVPPGGTSVAMPSAFGAGDMHGSSIYERYITDEGITVMLYVGQGEQTDDEEYTPKLILP